VTRADWARLVDRFGSAVFGGLVTGFLVGGVGGRLAMFVLRLTSSEGVRGIRSDDDFEIGVFSTETIFLLAFATLLGATFAVLHLVVRRWLPERHRPLQAAVFFGLVGGAVVIHPDGVDFTLLDPLWLAVALFVALPALFGWCMVALVEHRLAGDHGLRKANAGAIVFFVVIGFVGVVPLLLVPLAVAVVLIGHRWPATGELARGPVVTGVVRLALLTVAGLSAVALTRDVIEIL
jgi:hypothetical protein